ncbi:MAG: hypothetical protein KBT04_05115 [Bacteroidales bacterium]|nr:hypothetical protein [Candidatus Colimorpha onthohippi]
MKKSVLFISFLLMTLQPLLAGRHASLRNTYTDSYLGIGARAGMGGISLTGDLDADNRFGFSYGFDLNYQGGFGSRFGFLIGANLSFFSNSVLVSNITSEFTGPIQGTTIFGSTDMIAHYVGTTKTVEEAYTSMYLQVPVMLSFNAENLFLNAGLKFAIPLSVKATYNCSETHVVMDRVETTGTEVDPAFDIADYDGLEGAYSIYDGIGKMRTLSVLLSAELGYRFFIYGGNSLQFSVYADFSVKNQSLDNSAESNVLTLGSDDIAYRGILNAQNTTGLNFFNFGARVQFNLGLGRAPMSGRAIRIL